MGIFLTETGFQKKTLAELKVEYEDLFKAQFGQDIDLDADGPFGQIVGILSKRDADIWDGAEEIYTSRNPNEATGVSLDNIAAENAIQRKAATATTVQNTYLIGTEGTIVASGKQATQAEGNVTYSLDASVTIQKSAARFLELSPNISFPAAGGEVFTVTLDAVPYSYTAIASDSKKIVLDALVSAITAGAFGGTSLNLNDLLLEITFVTQDFSVSFTATFDETRLGSAGDFTADVTGPNPLPSTSLDTIVTPVSGWAEVINTLAGNTGEDIESDSAFRIRREASIQQGNATDPAIKAALINEVTNVTSASVTSNRTLVTDGEGRPAKSFESVVAGGTDADVAAKIFEVQPSGIESFGNTTEIVVDSEGNNQTIKFSRATNQYAWVDVEYELYGEEQFPSNGEDLIRDEIVAWALLNQTVGVDIIRQRLNIPIYEVPGIGDITIKIDITPTVGGPPTLVEEDKVISSREIAVFATSRISLLQV